MSWPTPEELWGADWKERADAEIAARRNLPIQPKLGGFPKLRTVRPRFQRRGPLPQLSALPGTFVTKSKGQ